MSDTNRTSKTQLFRVSYTVHTEISAETQLQAMKMVMEAGEIFDSEKENWSVRLADETTRDDLESQIYALLVRRGYAQHEADAIAKGPGCTLDCVQKGYPDIDCPAHGRRAVEPKPVLEHRFIPDGSDPERCQVCPFAKAAHQNTGAEKASGEPVTLICEGCGAKAELPRIGQEANFVSVIPANGWELYPKHLCPKCVK